MKAPEAEEMADACQHPELAGINMSEEASALTPEAAATLMASPWSVATPASSALARHDGPAHTPPLDVGSAGMPPYVSLGGPDGLRGMTGHLTRAAALLEAAEAARGHDPDARANALQHGGRGCGCILHGLPREKHTRGD